MSRFGNLEFGESPQRDESGAEPLKDEAFYLKEAQGLFEGGRFEQALRSYARALEFNPKSSAAWAGQVRMLIELGEFREAKVWAEKALLLFPRDGELLAAKAVALARAGDTKGALAYSDASIEVETATPYTWLARGDVLLARKEKRAEYCFEKAMALGRENWVWVWMASRIQMFYRQAAQALKFAQQALSLEPARAILWQQLARCEGALGWKAKAEVSLERARELDRNCPDLDEIFNEIGSGSWLGRVMRRISFGR